MTAMELIKNLSEFDLNEEIIIRDEQGQDYEIYEKWVYPEYDKQLNKNYIVIGISEI